MIPVKMSDLITNTRTKDVMVNLPYPESGITRDTSELILNTQSASSLSLAVATEGAINKVTRFCMLSFSVDAFIIVLVSIAIWVSMETQQSALENYKINVRW